MLIVRHLLVMKISKKSERHIKNTQLIIESLDNLTDIYDETMVQFLSSNANLKNKNELGEFDFFVDDPAR